MLNFILLDIAQTDQIFFQDTATPTMSGIINCYQHVFFFLLFLLFIIAIILFVDSNTQVSVYHSRSSIFMDGDNGMVPPPRNLLEKVAKFVKDILSQKDSNSIKNYMWEPFVEELLPSKKLIFCIAGVGIIITIGCVCFWQETIIDWASATSAKSHLISEGINSSTTKGTNLSTESKGTNLSTETKSTNLIQDKNNVNTLTKESTVSLDLPVKLPTFYTDFSGNIKILETIQIKKFKFLRAPICFEGLNFKFFSTIAIEYLKILNLNKLYLLEDLKVKHIFSGLDNQRFCGKFLSVDVNNLVVNNIKKIYLPTVESFKICPLLDDPTKRELKGCLNLFNIFEPEYELFFNNQIRYLSFLKGGLHINCVKEPNISHILTKCHFNMGAGSKPITLNCILFSYDEEKKTIKILEYCGINGNMGEAENISSLVEKLVLDNEFRKNTFLFVIESKILEDILLREEFITKSESMDFEIFKSKLKLRFE